MIRKINTKTLVLIFAATLSTATIAQNTDAEDALKKQLAEGKQGWENGGTVSVNLNQLALSNWAAGGQNSIAINGLLDLFAHHRNGDAVWENYLKIGYGTIKQGDDGNWLKTDDRIDFTSKYGKKAFTNWYYAGLLNFKTQMTDGYNYPNDSDMVSGFLAPAYFLGALGLDYKAKDDFSFFVAPLTLKTTIVNDQVLADAASFGVDAGEKIRNEMGGYLRVSYNKDIMEGITLQTKLDLFSNYLENPEFIDVNLEALLSMKINKYISASLSAQLIYDHDVVAPQDTEAKTQFKEVLGIGVFYKF